ncbi:IclR family transcriptional regulator domain-containing protein [Prauserella cavernicola]|uniref:IclR family transcriptional regulator domain-containing protein n=1 Tax=Prauserella cavernicola TaxID=2800127 RepID=UPI0027DC349B|nr:IclR family transcriptional regulator C-terminal domain-containing protein [Prauserella cavernicola]
MANDNDSDTAGGKRPPEGMAGLAKGLAIIEAFTAERTQLTVTDAARATGITPAAARRCLLTLRELGYLQHEGGYFRPTPRMMRLGAAYLEAAGLPALAQPFVLAARDELAESVSVAVYEAGSALIVARAEVQRIVNTGVRMGAQLPAYASASGRVLLAGLGEAELTAYLDSCEPVRTTSNTLMTIPEIRSRVELARAEGVAFTNEELELGVRSMAVPVADSAGRVRAAMTASTFTARASIEEMRVKFLPVLREQAAGLGRIL